MHASIRGLSMAAAMAVVVSLSGATAASSQTAGPDTVRSWTTAWTASPQRASASFQKNWSEEGFHDQTIRQVVRVTAPGDQVRIQLSNRYGTSPLRISGARVAHAAKAAAEEPDSAHAVTFDGRESVTIPVGEQLTSDPVAVRVDRLEKVTVSLYLREPHRLCHLP